MKNIKILSIVCMAMLFFLVSPYFLSAQKGDSYDVLFINGRVLDGTGNPCFYADVGVRDGKIAAVGRLKNKAKAARIIDIEGKITPNSISLFKP